MQLSDLCWNTFLGILVILTIVFGLYSRLLVTQWWKLRDYRSRMALPIVGNCWNPEVFSLFRHMARLRKEFGKTFVLYLFTTPYIVTVDPQLARAVLGDAKNFISVIEDNKSKKALFGESLLTTLLEKHRKSKHTLSKFFSIPNVSRRVPILNRTFCESMKRLIDTPMGEQTEMIFDINKFFAASSLRAFFSYTCGVDFKGDLKREEEILHSLWVTGQTDSKVNILPVFSFPLLSGSSEKGTLEAGQKVRDTLLSLLNQFRNTQLFDSGRLQPDQKEGLLAFLLQQDMSDEEIVDHLYTLLCASIHSTSVFMSFLCLLLAENPEAQEKLRHEVFMQAGKDSEITIEKIYQMKYLPMVLQETLRLYATVPYVTRRSTSAVQLKSHGLNYTIPADTDILVPLSLLNRDPDVWAAPSKFMPERFAGGKDHFLSAPEGFFPFGYGARACVGGVLVQLKASALICNMLRRYAFRPEPGFKVTVNAGMSLVPTSGVRVVVEKLPL
jgi:cytochrome P450